MIAAAIRKLHPLFRLRQHAVGRAFLRQFDSEVWLHPDRIGFPIRGRRFQHSVMSRGYGPEQVKLFAELLSHDTESFWDVGANIGFYSWLSQSLQPSVPVEAFE